MWRFPFHLDEPIVSLRWEAGRLVMWEEGERVVLLSEPMPSLYDEPAHPGTGHPLAPPVRAQAARLNRFDTLMATHQAAPPVAARAGASGRVIPPPPLPVFRPAPVPVPPPAPRPPRDPEERLIAWDFPLWRKWRVADNLIRYMIVKTLGDKDLAAIDRLVALYHAH